MSSSVNKSIACSVPSAEYLDNEYLHHLLILAALEHNWEFNSSISATNFAFCLSMTASCSSAIRALAAPASVHKTVSLLF